ncbi:MAG: hypothetical protein EOO14_01955 [Chitinophagaceae bacterium]|nr:MAG: hypothetical protein EOO14_01955 [Chitinophagaceae bacterium]
MQRVAPVLPLIFVSLLAAIWSGWLRIGWHLPLSQAAAHHGALMVNSFLASLIFLERAVTFKKSWWLLLPFGNAVSLLAFAFNQPQLAQWLQIGGSVGFAAMCIYFTYKYGELYYFVFLAGAFCLVGGNLVLLKTHFYPAAVTWWMGFLLFTIVAERLELSRFLPLSKASRVILLLCLCVVMASLFWPFHLNGQLVFAGSVAATAVWLLRYDMARKSIKLQGQHRYSALLLIAGYVWLLIMAALIFIQEKLPFGYDAVLHSFFIGFVFSMIFSHAPIILPAVTKMPVKIYRPLLYLWFWLLQLSLAVRIVGDVTGNALARKAGGIANGMTILLFFLTIAILFRAEVQKRRKRLSKT